MTTLNEALQHQMERCASLLRVVCAYDHCDSDDDFQEVIEKARKALELLDALTEANAELTRLAHITTRGVRGQG